MWNTFNKNILPIMEKYVCTPVTKKTIGNTLHGQGLKSCSACRIPLLKKAHVLTHLKFYAKHLNDPEED